HNVNIEKSKVVQGFFTGGKVTQSNDNNQKPIEVSDTVPAMLTPGEFVVNSKVVEKNLPLLEHINKGGEADDIPKKLQTSDIEQTKENSSSVDQFLGSNLKKQNSSFTKNKILNSHNLNQNNLVQNKSSANNYSSPPLIFRTKNNDTSSQNDFDTPESWSSFEELINTDNNNYTNSNNETNYQNRSGVSSSDSSQASSNSRKKLSQKHQYVPKTQELDKGSKVEQNDFIQNKEKNSETINAPSDSKENDEMVFESLAREIYKKLRQELEIEKERQGSYLGRLAW
ncbi:hypothetical protein, partial [Rivularia sp. UHCC 0363]|uniref:hypothetical protein n=1 Tax=Rivularia sp. UHCC 0363 TaxID=3110244 RepID=UPI002B1FD6AD